MSTCRVWGRKGLRRGASGVGFVALLLAAGCATGPGPGGSADTWQGRGSRREFQLSTGSGQVGAAQWGPTELEPAEPAESRLPPVPEGWPEEASTDEELLAPFLACPTVVEYLALQRSVDMARVVGRLGDWNAVRLGALGPLVDARASKVLIGKRAAFLLKAMQDDGAYAQVFALFVIHTSFDDELDGLLRLLAGNKQLRQTLAGMEAVRQELERRGLKLSDYPERGERASDVLRGLGQAATDALHSSPASDGARYMAMSAQLQQMPPAYQQAQRELERELTREHFTSGNVALGAFDQLTFGVPLGFYHLATGTARGLGTLAERRYEEATRELAPAALLVALYAGGKGARYLAETRGAGAGLALPELRLAALRRVAWQVAERLGVDGLNELARYIRSSREAAIFVGAGGEPAAVALHEARGNVPRTQAYLAEARERPGIPESKAARGEVLGGLSSLVDEASGHSAEVLEVKLREAEMEASGPRLPADVALLKKLRATLSTPPPGVPEGSALWREYVAYREGRLSELKAGEKAKGPLRWESYEWLRGRFARGLAFERVMVALLRADAALPLAQRVWLKDFIDPLIETTVGVAKEGQPGVRFADVLVIERQPPAGQSPRVESFSFKSRDLSLLDGEALEAQMIADARDALRYYGESLNIRRRVLKYLGSEVQIRRVRLVYEGGELKPRNLDVLQKAVPAVQKKVRGVEVLIP
ncbi:hypothetical protein [Hyalangium versicolor]|uniref:hypothetical protein n=1 Tax=Hyalangium versicolor TaxID=2861190 RepID=UPI001CCF1B3A|nr:hypothetical protein [Hyalangium versicolor]